MKLDRTDALVGGVSAASLLAATGMLFDIWQAVYYAIPVLVLLFMLLGSLNARAAWSRGALVPVFAFWVVLTGLFVTGAALMGSSARLGGLPASTGVFLYVIWPVSTIGAPLVYARVYSRWLAVDLAPPAHDRQAS